MSSAATSGARSVGSAALRLPLLCRQRLLLMLIAFCSSPSCPFVAVLRVCGVRNYWLRLQAQQSDDLVEPITFLFNKL